MRRWPAFDESLVRADEVEIVVQVDGKRRTALRVPAGTPQDEVEQAARADPVVQPWLAGRRIVRTIFVPGRLVNLVTEPGA